MNIHLISLGCPKNLVDSEKILGGIQNENVQFVNEPSTADTIIINTCGFIEDAKKESIETIFSAVKLKRSGSLQNLLITGCLSERYKSELLEEIPEIDGIWGAREIENSALEMAVFLGLSNGKLKNQDRIVTTQPVYAYLKIAEGCDNLCSFCSIPAIRGPHKSRPESEILAEAKQLTDQGIKELILISQDTTYYGREKKSDSTLASLLRKMEKNSDANWIRILYTYPERITDELVDVIADSEKICSYLDIPLQHVSDRILRDMRRGSRRVKIEKLIEKLRNRIQNLAIRTSLIVGFPGETEEEFEELCDFVQQQKFERLGIFKFSAEEGTDAANFDDQIHEGVKIDRFNILMDLQQDISYSLNQNWVGKNLEIIVDQKNDGNKESVGRTKWDAPEIDNTVYLTSEVDPGSFVNATVFDATAHDLYASICN